MRMLSRVNGKLIISSDDDPPARYAILSHRWLEKGDEVSFRDIRTGDVEQAWFRKSGLAKIDFCLKEAAKRSIDSVWIDSCCINSDDKTEQRRAIRQMFEYYEKASICYVYLADVTGTDWQQTFAASQWFTRGWTLQELVAPPLVCFYTCDCKYIGNQDSLSRELLAIMGINRRTSLQQVPIHRRFQWSLARVTTQPEDMSYCLSGILGIELLANYGEGANSARERLLDAVATQYGRHAKREVILIMNPTSADVSLTIEQICALLDISSATEGGAHIPVAFHGTCHWLLEHPDFKAWNNLDTQFLWIKGVGGTGKSVLMKYAAHSARKDCAQMSFFFKWDGRQGFVQEMYRSLIYQFLAEVVTTQEPVRRFLEEEKVCTGTVNMTLPILQAAFRIAVRSITQPVQCFIDAIDQCENSELEDMIYFLEDVCYKTPLHICFASRYISLPTFKSKTLLLEAQLGKKAMDYVRDKLNSGKDLQDLVIRKANGSFLYAVQVVRFLNDRMSTRTLYELYEHINAA